MNHLIAVVKDQIESLLFFGIKQPTNTDMPLNKQTKRTRFCETNHRSMVRIIADE